MAGRIRSHDPAPAVLTDHALDRLGERFRMAPDTLTRALDLLKSRRLGVSSDTRIAHFLMWSPDDGEHAIAIQNVITGQVLTVLTVAMYAKTYPTRLRGNALQKTINELVYAGEAPASEWRFIPCANERVQVFVRQFGKARACFIGNWRGEVATALLAHLGAIPGFLPWVAQRVEARGVDFNAIIGIAAKFPGGDLQDVPIPGS